MESITFTEILTTYWSQTLILLGVLGYFGKRYFDSKDKKYEIHHSLFQNRAFDAIQNYLKLFTEVQHIWMYEANNLFHEIKTSSDVDKIISSKLFELDHAKIIVGLLTNEDIADTITKITNAQFRLLNVLLSVVITKDSNSNVEFEYSSKDNISKEEALKRVLIEKQAEYWKARGEMAKELDKCLQELKKQLSKAFFVKKIDEKFLQRNE